MLQKILILRFGAIGDVVHSTALFRSIKQAYPEVEIYYATFKTPSLNIQNDPDLKKVFILEGKTYAYFIKFAKELRKENFDVLINLQPSVKTKFFCMLLGVRKILTYKKTFKLHAVENFWRTAKPVFKNIKLPEELKLYIKEESEKKIKSMINTEKPVIAFNPGVSSTRQGRRWSVNYWKELAGKLIENYDCEIVLTGSKEDKEFVEQILDKSHGIKSFCGKLTIPENTALLSLCDIVISGDTGPLHIATAVNTFAIGLYGAAPIMRTGPYGKHCVALNSDRDCVPCNRRKCKYLKKGELYTPCMLDIKPETVFEKIKKHLKQSNRV